MSAISSPAASGSDAGRLNSPPQGHRPHRHKKFHVRREALGEGYETYDVLSEGSSGSRGGTAFVPDRNGEAKEANAEAPSPGKAAAEWEKVSEKETSARAARNALRYWFWGFAACVGLVLLLVYRGWLWQVADWLYRFPFPAR